MLSRLTPTLTVSVPRRTFARARRFIPSSQSRAASPGSIPVLPILKYADPQLRADNAEITLFDEALAHKAQALFKLMYLLKGVGLAAPQVGINECLVVMNAEGEKGKGMPQHELALANPKILTRSPATDIDQESCLSVPLVYGDVERSVSIVVQYHTLSGEPKREEFSGYPARILQHELDHLGGVLFVDRMGAEELEGYSGRLQRYTEDGTKHVSTGARGAVEEK